MEPIGESRIFKEAYTIGRKLQKCAVIFTEHIMVTDQDATRSYFDLNKDDLLEEFQDELTSPEGMSEEDENLLYANLLISTLYMIKPKYRKAFIAYQASIQKAPALWLEEFHELMDTYRIEITSQPENGLEDERAYDENMVKFEEVRKSYIRSAKRELPPLQWKGTAAQLTELVLALKEYLKYDKLKINEDTKLIRAFAQMFEFEIDDISNRIKSVCERKTDDLKFISILGKSFTNYCDEREKREIKK